METPGNYMFNADTDINPNSNFYLLTKREYFAAMALQGLLAANAPTPHFDNPTAAIATTAVKLADELITQLNKIPPTRREVSPESTCNQSS